MEDKKYPKFVVGSFIINSDGKLFLRTTPSQGEKYTCINAKVEWGKTIEETLINSVKEKTNLEIKNFEFIGLTNGLNIPISNSETTNMIFADYKVFIDDISEFKQDSEREYQWLTPAEWLKLDNNKFGPYIKEIIQKLA
ncbi:MAG TPA: NUDIX domain-containing protein [Candidatus Paceibacterota bacterium]|nr:NUDIX domain-containing protein [Candidatus Paceibacterota bacterium]HPT17846.1 NUDIX domain-containing protein [Candidatus Paceibacterota bacterium]